MNTKTNWKEFYLPIKTQSTFFQYDISGSILWYMFCKNENCWAAIKILEFEILKIIVQTIDLKIST